MSPVPAAWRRVPIRETYLGLYDGPHATPKPSDEGPVFLGIGNITEDGHLDLSGVRHIAEEDFAHWTKRVEPREGDIVFTYEATLNRYAIIPRDFRGCLGRRLALIRPNPKLVDTRFLHFYFFSADWRTTIAGNTLSGATVDRVPLTRFPDFPINLPPLKTQRRIASILSAYDDLIENNTRRIAILEEMARRIYEEWFVRFRFPGHEGVRMVESELGLVPEGWAPCRLERVCSRMNSGNTPSRSNPAYWDGGTVAWYKTKELWDGYLFESEERISELAVAEKKTRVFEAGTILMAIYGSPTVGRLGITTARCACNQAALGMLPDPTKVTFWMLYYTLLALRVELNNKAQGAAQQNISKEKVAEMPFLLPAMETQRRFDEVVGPMQAMIRNLQERNRNLRTTRDLLLPKLISGELDVSAMPEPEALAA